MDIVSYQAVLNTLQQLEVDYARLEVQTVLLSSAACCTSVAAVTLRDRMRANTGSQWKLCQTYKTMAGGPSTYLGAAALSAADMLRAVPAREGICNNCRALSCNSCAVQSRQYSVGGRSTTTGRRACDMSLGAYLAYSQHCSCWVRAFSVSPAALCSAWSPPF